MEILSSINFIVASNVRYAKPLGNTLPIPLRNSPDISARIDGCFPLPNTTICTRFGEGRWQFDHRRPRGVLNPCARESKAGTGRLLREKLISDHGLFFSYEGQQGGANGQDSWGFFRVPQGFGRLDAGSRVGFTSSRPRPLWTSVFQLSLILYDVWP